jgi:hypothetical protein
MVALGCATLTPTYAAAWRMGASTVRKSLAILMLAVAMPLHAAPCAGIDRVLTDAQKHTWSLTIAKQLQVGNAEVLQTFQLDNWRIIYVATNRSDNAFLFYRDDPQRSHYITVWAGYAQADEEASIAQWTRSQVRGIPDTLAQCFAWYVTQHRDM